MTGVSIDLGFSTNCKIELVALMPADAASFTECHGATFASVSM